MKSIYRFIRVNIQILFVVSVLANIGLGVLNFVVQPILRTAAVASAVATTKAQAELSERKAVAKAKAKARLRRVVMAFPVAGAVGFGAFEYSDYQAWLDENPEGSMDEYATEVAVLSKEVAGEVLEELPAATRPDSQRLLSWLDKAMNALRAFYPSEAQ